MYYLRVNLSVLWAAAVLLASRDLRADETYFCGYKNGAPWFTINYKPKGQRCRLMSPKRSGRRRWKGAKCTAIRYPHTIFYKCVKDGLLWYFNRNLPSRRHTSVDRPPTGNADRGGSLEVAATVEDPKKFTDIVRRAAATYGIPEALLQAVIMVESRFNPVAVSPVGAQGLMQLMPATAEFLAVEDPYDPEQSIMAGARLLRRLSDRYGGDLRRTVAAYYVGPARVSSSGPIPEQARGYVRKVLAYYERFSKGGAKGTSSERED